MSEGSPVPLPNTRRRSTEVLSDLGGRTYEHQFKSEAVVTTVSDAAWSGNSTTEPDNLTKIAHMNSRPSSAAFSPDSASNPRPSSSSSAREHVMRIKGSLSPEHGAKEQDRFAAHVVTIPMNIDSGDQLTHAFSQLNIPSLFEMSHIRRQERAERPISPGKVHALKLEEIRKNSPPRRPKSAPDVPGSPVDASATTGENSSGFKMSIDSTNPKKGFADSPPGVVSAVMYAPRYTMNLEMSDEQARTEQKKSRRVKYDENKLYSRYSRTKSAAGPRPRSQAANAGTGHATPQGKRRPKSSPSSLSDKALNRRQLSKATSGVKAYPKERTSLQPSVNAPQLFSSLKDNFEGFGVPIRGSKYSLNPLGSRHWNEDIGFHQMKHNAGFEYESTFQLPSLHAPDMHEQDIKSEDLLRLKTAVRNAEDAAKIREDALKVQSTIKEGAERDGKRIKRKGDDVIAELQKYYSLSSDVGEESSNENSKEDSSTHVTNEKRKVNLDLDTAYLSRDEVAGEIDLSLGGSEDCEDDLSLPSGVRVDPPIAPPATAQNLEQQPTTFNSLGSPQNSSPRSHKSSSSLHQGASHSSVPGSTQSGNSFVMSKVRSKADPLKFQVHNRVLGWKLTSHKSRRRLMQDVSRLGNDDMASTDALSKHEQKRRVKLRSEKAWQDTVGRFMLARAVNPRERIKLERSARPGTTQSAYFVDRTGLLSTARRTAAPTPLTREGLEREKGIKQAEQRALGEELSSTHVPLAEMHPTIRSLANDNNNAIDSMTRSLERLGDQLFEQKQNIMVNSLLGDSLTTESKSGILSSLGPSPRKLKAYPKFEFGEKETSGTPAAILGIALNEAFLKKLYDHDGNKDQGDDSDEDDEIDGNSLALY
jgi:hypothetical protein